MLHLYNQGSALAVSMPKPVPLRIIFNQGIPQDLGFIDRNEDPFQYEISFPVMKKTMGTIIEKVIRTHGLTESAKVIDYIKALGFKYSTLAGITFSMDDVKVPHISSSR